MGTEQNILTKSVTAKYLPVADWMKSVIYIILDMRASVGGTMTLRLQYPW